MVPRRVPHRRRGNRARDALDDDNGSGRVSDPYIPAQIRAGARPGSAQSIQEAIISDLN